MSHGHGRPSLERREAELLERRRQAIAALFATQRELDVIRPGSTTAASTGPVESQQQHGTGTSTADAAAVNASSLRSDPVALAARIAFNREQALAKRRARASAEAARAAGLTPATGADSQLPTAPVVAVVPVPVAIGDTAVAGNKAGQLNDLVGLLNAGNPARNLGSRLEAAAAGRRIVAPTSTASGSGDPYPLSGSTSASNCPPRKRPRRDVQPVEVEMEQEEDSLVEVSTADAPEVALPPPAGPIEVDSSQEAGASAP